MGTTGKAGAGRREGSMDEANKYRYFYGQEGEQFSFFRIPKMLVRDERFAPLSCEAKMLYGLFLDRMSLSIANGWKDSGNRVYIIYTLQEIQKDLRCGKGKAVKVLAELDSVKGAGLIERKRRGLGQPDLIYVKNFVSPGHPCGGKDKGNSGGGKGAQDAERKTHTEQGTDGDAEAVTIGSRESRSRESGSQSQPKPAEDASSVPDFLNTGKVTSGSADLMSTGNGNPGFQKTDPNNTELIKTYSSDTDPFYPGYTFTDGALSFLPSSTDSGNDGKAGYLTGCPCPSSTACRNDPIGEPEEGNGTEEDGVYWTGLPLAETGGGAEVPSGMDTGRLSGYAALIRDNTGYDRLRAEMEPDRRAVLDSLYAVMCETVCRNDDSGIRIAGREMPLEAVRSRLLKLDGGHIRHAVDVVAQTQGRIRSFKAYALTVLYNAPENSRMLVPSGAGSRRYGNGSEGLPSPWVLPEPGADGRRIRPWERADVDWDAVQAALFDSA